MGLPVSREENEEMREQIRQYFETRPRGQVEFQDFSVLCARLNFPLYAKRALFDACCQLNNLSSGLENATDAVASTSYAELCEPITFSQFCVFWNK